MIDRPTPSPSDTSLHLAGRLIPGGPALDVRVYYEDTDFSGIV